MREFLRFSLFCCLIISFVGCTIYDPVQPSAIDKAEDEFNYCWDFLREESIFQELLPENPYVYRNISSLYKSVGDRWTVYYDIDIAKLYMSYLESSEIGAGLEIAAVSEGAVITAVDDKSPGALAGLLVGDTIVGVDGRSIAGLSAETVTGLIDGDEGEHRQLDIRRTTGRVLVTVVLASYATPTVFTDSLDSAVSYIYLTQFVNESTHPEGSEGEIHQALANSAWADYTILDLRGNPGGFIGQSLNILGEFVPAGTAAVNSLERYYDTVDSLYKTRFGAFNTTRSDGLALNRKIFVLIDEGSASAAEIVVTGLRDNRPDVLIIGSTTYGKARGQRFKYPTPDSGLAKVTLSLLSPIKGEAYDEVGIKPDVQVQIGEDALTIARQRIRMAQGGTLAKRRVEHNNLEQIALVRKRFQQQHHEPKALIEGFGNSPF